MTDQSDNNKAPEFLAVFATGTLVAMVLVCLRLWVRAKIIRKVALDDWVVVISLVKSKHLILVLDHLEQENFMLNYDTLYLLGFNPVSIKPHGYIRPLRSRQT